MSVLTRTNERGKTVVVITHDADIAAYARKTDNGRAVLKSAEYTKIDDIDISDSVTFVWEISK